MKIKSMCQLKHSQLLKRITLKSLAFGLLLNSGIISSTKIMYKGNAYNETSKVFIGNNIKIDNILEESKVNLEVEGKTFCNLLKNIEWQVRNDYLYNSSLDISVSGKTLTLINLSNKPILLCLNSGNTVGFGGSSAENITIPANSVLIEKIPTNRSLRTFAGTTSAGWDLSADSKNIMNKLVVLEGEYDKNLIPRNYFEGMLSVGELDKNIQLTVQNKNLWDGELELGSLANGNGNIESSTTNLRTKNFIEVEGGKTYTLSNDMKYNNYIYEYDKDKKFIKYYGVKNVNPVTLTLSDNTKYVKFRSTMNEKQNNLNVKYLFELSDKQTSYVAPDNRVLDFYLNEPLRGIPGLISDKIISKSGQWVIERNCGERNYNSNLDTNNNEIITDKIKTIYKLEQPRYEFLMDDSGINLYKDKTYIYLKSDIPTLVKATIDVTLDKAKEYLEIVISNPTLENILNARMFINSLEESILKDQLQSYLNNIIKIDDLVIEKKTESANVDVYIKSQNSLSISLSTNFILFEDFSGVKDIEKLNALNISIDSSLPYQINSYLESEIQNSNGTKVIPKELLNIKLNNKNEYKSFTDINKELILEDNCDKGSRSYGVDLMLNGGLTHKADIYRTVIKFEAEQK